MVNEQKLFDSPLYTTLITIMNYLASKKSDELLNLLQRK